MMLVTVLEHSNVGVPAKKNMQTHILFFPPSVADKELRYLRRDSDQATGCTIEHSSFDSRHEQGSFIIAKLSVSVLEPKEPPVQWVTAAVSSEVKRSGRVANCWTPFRAEVKNRWICTSTHSCVSMARIVDVLRCACVSKSVVPCPLLPLQIVRLPAIRVSCIMNTGCEAAECSDKQTHPTTPTAPPR
jgi:hypothetical protein